MIEAFSSWTTWAVLGGAWLAVSVGCAFAMGRFFRQAQGAPDQVSGVSASGVSAERAGTTPEFFADFAEIAGNADSAQSDLEDASAPRSSGTRFRPVVGSVDAPGVRKRA